MPDPYISEVKYLGGASADFIEITVDEGYDVSNILVTVYNTNGTVRTVNALGSPAATIAGKDIYLIDTTTSATFNGLNKQGGVALEDDGTLLSFISFEDRSTPLVANGGIADGETADEVGGAGSGESLESTDGVNFSTNTSPTPGSVPCLCAGTRVLTRDGLIPVEGLKPGMLIPTRDNGDMPLRFVLSRKVTAKDKARNPKLNPIKITAGALGLNVPARDLWVSRQHRMVVSSPIAQRMTGSTSVFVAAIHLTGLPGVHIDPTECDVEYFHLVFDEHVALFAEGAETESLLLGPGTREAVTPAALQEIESLFPDHLHQQMPSIPIPPAARQKRLVSRHLQNQKPLQPAA